jgi:hypothetical protein
LYSTISHFFEIFIWVQHLFFQWFWHS